MRLHWKLLVSPTRYEQGRVVDLRDQPSRTFTVETGRFIAVLTVEKLGMPLTLSGRFGLRSEYTRRGLVAFPGIQIDPGFKGRLAISLFNAGPEPIELKYRAKMFTVEFHTLETPASEGYGGDYHDQDDFPLDQEKFILNAHTISISEIAALPREVSSLERRIALHEATHVLTSPLSFEELAAAQGVQPYRGLEDLAGGWPEDEDIDKFLEAVRIWRSR